MQAWGLGRLMGLGWVLLSLAPGCLAASEAAPVPALRLQAQQALLLPLSVDQPLLLQLPSPGDSPWVLLVEQRNIDSQIECEGGPALSAPTGRVGIDVAIVDVALDCRVSARMPRARPGQVRVSLLPAATRPLGADLALWQRFAEAQLGREEQAAQDAAIALLQGFEHSSAEPLLVLSAVYGRGKLHMRRSHSEAALADLRLAASLAEQHGLREFLPAIHNGAGLTLLKTRDLAEADRAFQWAESVARAIDAGYELASALNNRGQVDHHRGDLRSAARHYQGAIEAYRQAGEMDHFAVALMNHAAAAGQLGQVREAREALQQAVAIRRDGPSRRSLAIALQNLGQLSARVGDWGVALATTLEAQQLLEELGQPADLIQIYLVRSELYLALAQPQRARHYAGLAQAQLVPEIAALQTPAVQAMQARLEADPSKALKLHRAAADGHRDNRRHAYAAAARLNQAQLAAQLGQWPEVADALAAAAVDLSRSGPSLQARARLLEARLHFALAPPAAGADGSILDQVQAAEAAFLELRDHQGAFDAALLRARLALSAGHHDAAEQALRDALTAHRRLSASVPTPNLGASLTAARKPWKDVALHWFAAARQGQSAARTLIQLLDDWPLLQELDPGVPSELLQTYRYKVSALADANLDASLRRELMLELEALESAIEAAPTAARMFDQPATAAKRSATAMPVRPALRYVVGSEQSLLLVDRGEDIEAVPLPGRSELQRRVQQGLSSPWQLRELAGLLLPPATAELPQPWAIVADEALHDLPFAALWLTLGNGAGAPPYLVTSPGVTNPGVRDRGVTDRGEPQALRQTLGGASRLASLLPGQSSDGPSLNGVGIERAALAELLGPRFLGISANGPAPLGLPEVEILHVAGHGWIARELPMASTVADAPFGSSDGQGGVIEPTHLAGGNALRLILLSACEGASGDAHGSGYSLAARYARHFNVPVIAPVEPVDDGDAAQFMRLLVQQLQQQELLQAYAHSVRHTADSGLRHYSPWQLVLP